MEEQNEKVNLEEVLKRLSLLEKQNAIFVEKERIQKEQEYEKIRIEEEKIKKEKEEKIRKEKENEISRKLWNNYFDENTCNRFKAELLDCYRNILENPKEISDIKNYINNL